MHCFLWLNHAAGPVYSQESTLNGWVLISERKFWRKLILVPLFYIFSYFFSAQKKIACSILYRPKN
jgi:hypothetical protein